MLFHEHSGGLHFFDGSLGIIGIEVDATAPFENQVSLKPEAGGVQRCEFHAVVRGEAQDENRVDAVLLKIGFSILCL